MLEINYALFNRVGRFWLWCRLPLSHFAVNYGAERVARHAACHNVTFGVEKDDVAAPSLGGKIFVDLVRKSDHNVACGQGAPLSVADHAKCSLSADPDLYFVVQMADEITVFTL